MPRRKGGNRPLIYIQYEYDSATTTNADRCIVDALINLHTETESLGSADGLVARVTRIRLNWRMYSNDQFAAMPLVIQTAGTVTDTVDLNDGKIQSCLDSAINDVFGWRPLCKDILHSKINSSNKFSADDGYHYSIEVAMDLPGDLIQLLNKQAESERLQDLIIGTWAYCPTVTTVQIECSAVFHYVMTTKGTIQ